MVMLTQVRPVNKQRDVDRQDGQFHAKAESHRDLETREAQETSPQLAGRRGAGAEQAQSRRRQRSASAYLPQVTTSRKAGRPTS